MKYVKTTLATEPRKESKWLEKTIIKFLYLILPRANPDFDNLYDNVRLWWLELDENNIPQREIGFDIKNTAIVLGPIGNNYGFFTDSGEKIDENDYEKIDSNQFISTWATY